MKSFFTLLVLVLTLQMTFAQKSCCSATVAFNDISEDKGFQSKHELKTYSGPALNGKMIHIPVNGEKSAMVYALKTDKKSDKYLFVIHEWWGLNDHIKEEADNYFSSLEGVNVLALDLYDGNVATTREEASEYMKSADQERIFNIINAVSEWAGDKAQIATVGWCFGGGWSMQSSIAIDEKAVGCVVYYGMPENDPAKLETLNCEVLGIFALEDRWINEEVVGTYEKAMKTAGKKYETHWYDAAHAFANPSNAKYNKQFAEEANSISLAFIKKALKVK